MDISSIKGFLDPNNPVAQTRALHYFEELKTADNGWRLSIDCLLTNKDVDEEVNFFCFQILMDYVRRRYPLVDVMEQQTIRNFISNWIQTQSQTSVPHKISIRNKATQVFTMFFIIDYPSRWPTFFDDILQTLNFGAIAADIYLRLLLSMNYEIADRETPRTTKEMEICTKIKDSMRDDCIQKLVDSWHHILVTYQSQNPDIICLCLEVIGSYVAWIDINLIANERFVSLFLNFLVVKQVRDATCDCISNIIDKGMSPVESIKLVESFMAVLEQAGILNISGDEEDEDFILRLANLVNEIGTTLLTDFSRLHKARDAEGISLGAEAVRSKVGLLLKFLDSEYEEVSQAVFDFAKEYLQFLKIQSNMGTYGAADVANVQAMLYIVINRYKYDNSANFTTQSHEEALFQAYRKSLKNIYDNLSLLDTTAVFNHTKAFIIKTLQQWQNAPFEDLEVAVTFLYLLGEIVPLSQGSGQAQDNILEERKSAMMDLIRMLVTCGVSNYDHVAVTLQFFETIVRFEKFFTMEPQHIPETLMAFTDSRGLRNSSPHVRSRTSYLFSRFIKALKAQVQNYTEDILRQLQDLLVLFPQQNGVPGGLLSPDDQLYLYETASILIMSSQFEPERKSLFLKTLLTPVFEKFEVLLQQLPTITDERQRHEVAKCMSHAIAVTSRTSKAFFSQQTMKSCGCTEVYLKALELFLTALNQPYEQNLLQSAVRQYLHRMVVCLENEVLPYFPMAAEQLLKTSDIRSIQEFIPLINQIISKFKTQIVPFLQQIFMPFVTVIFTALSAPIDEMDHTAQSDKQILQRSYFLFIAAIVTNNVTEVIASQSAQNLEQVLQTVIQGAVNFPDPVAQKTCFGILKKMVELWGGQNANEKFVQFVYSNIVPACFLAPLKDTFDLNDAQTILALSESALCLKMVLEKRGPEFVSYLQNQYLPTLNVSPDRIQAYCEALKSNPKTFKAYLKFFFQKART